MMRMPESMPMSSTGSVSNKIEMFEKKLSPEKRAPSPGMAGIGLKRRPPSPGMGSPLNPISNKMNPITSSSPRSTPSKRRPMPGGAGPPSPGDVSFGNRSQTKESPNENGSVRKRGPSPGGMHMSPSPRFSTAPSESTRENIEPKRFVFTSEATGITPTNIQIGSQPQQLETRGNLPIQPEVVSNMVQQQQQQQQQQLQYDHNNMQPQSLGNKNSNPIRDNPAFLQRMSENFDSDEDESLKNNANAQNQMKKLAELASSTTNASMNLNTDDESIDIPIKATKPVLTRNKSAERFSQPAKHWVKLKPTEKKSKEVHSSDALMRKFSQTSLEPAPVVVEPPPLEVKPPPLVVEPPPLVVEPPPLVVKPTPPSDEPSHPSNEPELQNFTQQVATVISSEASVTSSMSMSSKLTPSKKAVIDKLKEARGRKKEPRKKSVSPQRKSKSTSSSPRKTRQSKSPTKSISPSRKIIKPSPVKASGPLFIPIRRNNDDSSVSSYSTRSFKSAVYGKKNGETLSKKAKLASSRASSRSPMRYRPFEEGIRQLKSSSTEEDTNGKKGISIIQAQNLAVRHMEAVGKQREEEQKSKQIISRVNSNFARLKALKDEQRLREEEKQRLRENLQDGKGNSKHKYRSKKQEKKPLVAEDEFTVDAEVLSVDGDSKSTSSIDDVNEKKAKKKGQKAQIKSKKKSHSQWAQIMQNRMAVTDNDNDESSFEGEFNQADNWETPPPSTQAVTSKQMKSPVIQKDPNKTNLVKSKHQSPIKNSPHAEASVSDIVMDDITDFMAMEIPRNTDLKQNKFEDTFDSPPIKQLTLKKKDANFGLSPSNYSSNQPQIELLSPLTKVLQQSNRVISPFKMGNHPSLPMPTTTSDQHVQNTDIDINPYVGAYANLLPRTTNPLIVRTSLPTLSSSLTNFQPVQPTLETLPPQVTPIQQSFQPESPLQTYVAPNINYIQSNLYPLNATSQAFLGSNVMEPTQKSTEPIRNIHLNPQISVNGFSSTQSSGREQNMKEIYGGEKSLEDFVLSHSTPDTDDINDIILNADKSGSQSKEDPSTLVGQDHVPSLPSSESEEGQSKSSDNVNKWWENNYASTQNQDVNDAVKQALKQALTGNAKKEKGDLKESEKLTTKKSSKNSKNKTNFDIDSDDDVFHGLDSPADQKSRKKLIKAASESDLDSILASDNDVDNEVKEEVKPVEKTKTSKKVDDYNQVDVRSSGSASDTSKHKKKNVTVGDKKDSSRKYFNEEYLAPIGRVSSKSAIGRGGLFINKYACGILNPMSTMDSPTSPRREKSHRIRGRSRRDDDAYDDETYFTDDYTNDYTNDYTYRSEGSQTNGSQTFDSRLDLSENEKRVWDNWDRKDNTSSFTRASSFDPSIMRQQQREENTERRSRAHEKLLMHAYIALSKPPPDVMREKGEEWQSNVKPQAHEKQTIGHYTGFNQQTIPEGPYYSDAENRAPQSFENEYEAQPRPMPSHSTNGAQSRPVTSLSHGPKQFERPADQDGRSYSEKTKGSSVSGGSNPNSTFRQSNSIAYQKHVLEKFCVRIKYMAVEVLKLNREKKWQTRYLTVSKEGTWLKNSAKSDACFCPLGLLWVKKFSKSREHSVLTIDKHGRGGILLANLIQVSIAEDKNGNSALTKTQLKKFHDSCIVNLHGKSSFVTLRCERNDADAIFVGCNAIIDVLRGSSNVSGNSAGSVIRPQSAAQSISSRKSGSRSLGTNFGDSSQVTNKSSLVNTLVANDLWEA